MKLNLHVKDSPHRKRSPRFFVVAASMAVACFATVQMPVMAFAGTINEQRLPDARISGKVTDEKGETLPGVSVSLKGTSTGVVTDIKGNFSLNVPNATSGTLVFSYSSNAGNGFCWYY